MYNLKIRTRQERDVITMNKKQELIERIEKLTDKQFELLINLFAQQELKSVRVAQSERRSFFQPSR
jgi:hypothetical protein